MLLRSAEFRALPQLMSDWTVVFFREPPNVDIDVQKVWTCDMTVQWFPETEMEVRKLKVAMTDAQECECECERCME